MRFVAITMMNNYDAARNEWRDVIDQRWGALLMQCQLLPIYIPNNAIIAQKILDELKPVGVLLSGGGDCAALTGNPDCRDETEQILLHWALNNHKAIFGICRGMQVLMNYFGVSLQAIDNHVAVRHNIRMAHCIRSVNSFHNYGVFETPDGFDAIARSSDNAIEAVRHHSRNITAIMWHPEREFPPSYLDITLISEIFNNEVS